jgi:acyl-CoA thioester hydrolase
MKNPSHRFASKVAFGDTDASGWMHFPNVFRYVEAAEHDFLQTHGILVFDRSKGGWPRVKVSCEYKRPLHCADSIEVLLKVTRVGASSVTWEFEVLNADGETASFGSMTNVRVDDEGRPQLISDEDRAQLELGIHPA